MNKCLERVDGRQFWNPGVFSYAIVPRCCPNSRVFLIVTSVVYGQNARSSIFSHLLRIFSRVLSIIENRETHGFGARAGEGPAMNLVPVQTHFEDGRNRGFLGRFKVQQVPTSAGRVGEHGFAARPPSGHPMNYFPASVRSQVGDHFLQARATVMEQ
jgi:hypothetical protein